MDPVTREYCFYTVPVDLVVCVFCWAVIVDIGIPAVPAAIVAAVMFWLILCLTNFLSVVDGRFHPGPPDIPARRPPRPDRRSSTNR